jgi:hypothetical protein
VCLQCSHPAASLLVMSTSLVTVQCTVCTYTWSLALEGLPEVARAPLNAWCGVDAVA